VRTAPALIKRGNAWDGYDDAAASLKAAIKKLAQFEGGSVLIGTN